MKEKVIETAGKAWRFLGQNGQTNVSQLPKSLKEKDEKREIARVMKR